MDDQRFDRLARAFAAGTSRRRALALLAAAGLAGRLPGRVAAQAACAPGLTDCGGVCVATCCDNANCGACGNVCPSGQTCFEGICGCPSGLCCEAGETVCDGTCVATCCNNDHCGACGNTCPAGLTCFEGVCDCPSGTCGPTPPPVVKLPSTGVGPTLGGAIAGASLATGSALAAATLAWMRRIRDAGGE